ncbi:MAG: hypothetical protein PHE39_07325 [Methanoculleus bourgensis]|nr:hypothetical protein [Methanoculleus bourgensis]
MEPITTATIIGSFLMGAVIGFITMGTGDLRIKAGIDAVGLIGIVLFLYLAMPTIVWGAPIDEATQQVSNFIVTAMYALVAYVIADAFGSLGYVAVTGSRG